MVETVFVVPSIVIEELPTVKIPVILASPPTTSSVVAPPTTVFPSVETPTTLKPAPTVTLP